LFDAKTDPEVFAQIRNGHVPSLAELRTDLPKPLVAAIHRSLDPDPAKRFPSARAMVHEISEILRKDESWGDADVLVGNSVAEARVAKQQLANKPA
jgi:hypothetical protein